MAACRREDVTAKIRHQKLLLKKNWRDLARELNLSVEYAVAACLGQMKLTPEQAQIAGKYFELSPEEWIWLTDIPYRNTLNGSLPSDPILYRLHEALGVYGPALKEVIHEEFGDGVMSAIDYSCKVERDGERVQIVLNGKFLPYNFYQKP